MPKRSRLWKFRSAREKEVFAQPTPGIKRCNLPRHICRALQFASRCGVYFGNKFLIQLGINSARTMPRLPGKDFAPLQL